MKNRPLHTMMRLAFEAIPINLKEEKQADIVERIVRTLARQDKPRRGGARRGRGRRT